MNFTKFKFYEVNRDTCTTRGCNNTPDDNCGVYCAMCKAQQGM